MRSSLILVILALIGFLGVPQYAARADIAPPKTPPGTTLLPGQGQTQVRMAAETVTLTVSSDAANPGKTLARTDAVFTMRNLGTAEEKMAVRFPLTFFNGINEARDGLPQIPSIRAQVDGKPVVTRRVSEPAYDSSPNGGAPADIPWSVFDVTFPPAQDVTVEVTYTVEGYGYYPQAIFDYILETGAGWKDSIGSVDIIVQLPYPASESNVLLDETDRSGGSTPGGVLNGNEVRWHRADLEPTPADNFEVILVMPSLWQSILKGQEAVKSSPKDGEAWGMLAKAYKQAALLPKGWTRDDPAGQQLIQLSERAYQTCLTLLPKDPLWHYGYADILWWNYYFDFCSMRKPDTQGLLPRALTELQTTLTLDPNNTLAKDLLDSIRGAVPEAVKLSGGRYDFLGLTATPGIPTPYPELATDTPPSAPSTTPLARQQVTPPTAFASPVPTAQNPVCGLGLLLIGAPAAAMLLVRGRHREGVD